MKKIITLLVLSVGLSACCNCDKVVPKKVNVNYFKTQQIIRENVPATTSPVAFSILLADSTNFRFDQLRVETASLFDFSTTRCDCLFQEYIANPITELKVFEVVNGKISDENSVNKFVGRITSDERISQFQSFRSYSILLSELKNFNLGQRGTAYVQLYDTTSIQTPNVQFLVKFTLTDGKKVELTTPQFFKK